MVDQLIKRSKFSFYGFGDTVSETDFQGNNFMVSYDEYTACFSMMLLKSLDYSSFKIMNAQYDSFIFDEPYIINKIVLFLKENTEIKFFKFRIDTEVVFEMRLTNIKIKSKSVIFQSFQ